MKKLTIGLFIEHYDPFISGAIISVKSLRYELEKRGHTVYIVCPSVKGYKDKDRFVIRTPAFATKMMDNTTTGFSSPALTRRLMNIKFDIIHIQDVYFVSMLGQRIAMRQNIPCIQTVHTLWDKFFDQYRLNPLVHIIGSLGLTFAYLKRLDFKPWLRVVWLPKHDEVGQKWPIMSRGIWQHMLNMCRVADAVIVPSVHQQKALTKAGLKDVHRVTNSFVPFQPSKPVLGPPDKLRILCVARLSDEKRMNVLIEAIKLVGDSDIELVIVGDGTDRPSLEYLAEELGVADKIKFLGSMSNQQVRQVMRESSALALASYNFDTQPLVFDEALDAGLPIIYCDPKFIEAVGSDNALLVDKNPAGFASAFRKLKNPKKRQRMAAASLSKAKDFQSSKAASQILKIYQSAIAKRAGSGSHRKP